MKFPPNAAPGMVLLVSAGWFGLVVLLSYFRWRRRRGRA